MSSNRKELSQEQLSELFSILKFRFEQHMSRHKDIEWTKVQAKLEISAAEKIWALSEMERTGGDPDIVGYDKDTEQYIFYDCSPESPKGRRSFCYDREALEARKKHKPKNSAVDVATNMRVEMLTEKQYRELQQLEELAGGLDANTSSWIKTPSEIRKLGGALFCDRRYNAVFTYHNGAESYYSSRGFRGLLRI